MRKSLFAQIFVYFLIVIIFSLSTVGLFTYWKSSQALDAQVENYVTRIINYAVQQTELYLRRYESASESVLSEKDVKQFLDLTPPDEYRYYELNQKIQNTIFQKLFISYPEIFMIYVIGDNGLAIVEDDQNLLNHTQFDPVKRLTYLRDRIPADGKIAVLKGGLISPPRVETITIARRIRGLVSYEPKGILAIEVKTREMADVWEKLNLGENGFFFIINDSGETIYWPKSLSLNDKEWEDITGRLNGQDNSFVLPVGNEPRLFVSRHSEYLGWEMVYSLPVKELRKPISNIRTTTLAVGLMTLCVALWIAYRFGRSIIRPIRRLKEGMRETEKGIWSRIDGYDCPDEIGGLIHRYNLMVTRLSEMIEKVYAAELKNQKSELALQKTRFERQKAELQALQLQINPHFLYNTLETINCYAIVQDSEEITEIVEAMAFMLRYSIQTNLEEITLVNELNHVRNFMIILKHRIGRDFEIDVAVSPALLLEKMVRLTLQPLVENVFQHAFKDGIAAHHYIRIDAQIKDDHFLITVEDNGLGIAPDALRQLRACLQSSTAEQTEQETVGRQQRGGIGLINVHRRIQLVYGEQYGLSIDSVPREGTTVTMKLPKK
ncbi:MAG TPA: sensor histidine kinase [Bacilli bacterium]